MVYIEIEIPEGLNMKYQFFKVTGHLKWKIYKHIFIIVENQVKLQELMNKFEKKYFFSILDTKLVILTKFYFRRTCSNYRKNIVTNYLNNWILINFDI